jgi:hypothetical protein
LISKNKTSFYPTELWEKYLKYDLPTIEKYSEKGSLTAQRMLTAYRYFMSAMISFRRDRDFKWWIYWAK